MGPVSVTVGALGLVENLNTIIKRYSETSNNEPVKDVTSKAILGELSAILDILTESKIMIDELIDQPTSLIPALTRCHEVIVKLERQMHEMRHRILFLRTSRVRETLTELRSAVTDFRAMVTQLVLLLTGSRPC